VPLLINSDAHQPNEVAREFDRALALVWDVGYRETVRFEKRVPKRAASLAKSARLRSAGTRVSASAKTAVMRHLIGCFAPKT
jgi:hypothetical protein